MDDVDRIQNIADNGAKKNCCKHISRRLGQLKCQIGYDYNRLKCFYGNGSCEEWVKR